MQIRTRGAVILLCLLAVCLALTAAGCGGNSPNANTATPAFTPDPRLGKTATFIAAGDIMLSRGVARAIDRAGRSDYPFEGVREHLLSTDFNFANLESPISGNDGRIGKGLVFNARRDHTDGLANFNFKILTLANNHAMDQLLPGLQYTRTFLDGMGIKHVGAGSNLAEAWKPAVVEANGVRVGFVGASYTSINDGGVARNDYVARMDDVENLRKAISQLKNESDFIVATMHAGVEYVRNPDKTQIAFAEAAIDAGADIVIGHHPHWVQTTSQYKGKPIFYSLGNFVFDQRKPETMRGLMLKVALKMTDAGDGKVRGKLEGIEMIPVVIENFAQPRPANQAEGKQILQSIGFDSPIYPLSKN
jgi:poly-gamma-glutamate capsule biosynthesis protein CapA/YwtB (metallophosphatase superfamily)